MPKTDRQQCEATTKSGARCSRKAYKNGKLCGLHGGKGEMAEAKAKSRARTTRLKSRNTDNFDPNFKEILEVCRAEENAPSDNSTKVQWVQVHLRIVVAALEHQRILDGIGTGVTYVSVTQPPTDKPKPPVDETMPSKAVDDVDGKETVH